MLLKVVVVRQRYCDKTGAAVYDRVVHSRFKDVGGTITKAFYFESPPLAISFVKVDFFDFAYEETAVLDAELYE